MKLYQLSLISILFFVYACEDKVNIDVPEGDEKLVIDGIFTNAPNSVITISKTAPYFNDGQTPRVSRVNVMVISNTNDTIVLTEDPASPGDYKTAVAGEIGKEYSLHLQLPNGEKYETSPQLMSRVPQIDTIYYKDAEELNDPFIEETGYVVFINTQEPAGKGDYYMWIYSLNGIDQRFPDDLQFASDELVDGNYVTEAEMADGVNLGDDVVVYQYSISEQAFNFMILVQEQTFTGGPFDPPPSPIKGNVKNTDPKKHDALGYFMVSGVSSASITIL